MVVDEKYAVILDFHVTWRGIQEILAYSKKSAEECYSKLYLAVYQAFTRTGDQNGLDVLDDDLRELNENADGTWEENCKDILNPRLTLALMRKFRRVNVLELLHDAFYHDPSPPPPKQISDKPAEIAVEEHFGCVVCFYRKRDVVLGNCGHCCLCHDCHKDIIRTAHEKGESAKCPLCRIDFGNDYTLKENELEELYVNETKEDEDESKIKYFIGKTDSDPGKLIVLSSHLRQTRAAPRQSDLQELLRQMRGGA
jgi:hypothetical protein